MSMIFHTEVEKKTDQVNSLDYLPWIHESLIIPVLRDMINIFKKLTRK